MIICDHYLAEGILVVIGASADAILDGLVGPECLLRLLGVQVLYDQGSLRILAGLAADLPHVHTVIRDRRQVILTPLLDEDDVAVGVCGLSRRKRVLHLQVSH